MELVTDTKILRQVSKPVHIKEGLHIGRQLIKFLNEYNKKIRRKGGMVGVGLSAIQLGLPKRVFIVKLAGPPIIFVNPVAVSHSSSQFLSKEGCLSLPNFTAEVLRYTKFTVQTANLGEQTFGIELTDEFDKVKLLESAIVQHELGHLSGKLISQQQE